MAKYPDCRCEELTARVKKLEEALEEIIELTAQPKDQWINIQKIAQEAIKEVK